MTIRTITKPKECIDLKHSKRAFALFLDLEVLTINSKTRAQR